MKRHTAVWFKTAAAVGVGIAVFLFIDTVVAYRYVATRLARDEGMLRAVEEVSSIEHELHREGAVATVDGLQRLLRTLSEDRDEEIAWISVLTSDLRVDASSGPVAPYSLPPADQVAAVMKRSGRYSAVQNTPRGEVLAVLLPMQQRFQLQAASGLRMPVWSKLRSICRRRRACFTRLDAISSSAPSRRFRC